jgi:hypothetical protein
MSVLYTSNSWRLQSLPIAIAQDRSVPPRAFNIYTHSEQTVYGLPRYKHVLHSFAIRERKYRSDILLAYAIIEQFLIHFIFFHVGGNYNAVIRHVRNI